MPGIRIGKPLPLVEGGQVERADAAENRRLLLAAALRIIERDGVDSLSMDRLAAEAGMGVGTAYRRFGDRSGLLYSLLDDDERRFQTAFLFGPPPLGPGAPAVERICAFMRAYLGRLERKAQLMAVTESHSSVFASAPHQALRLHLISLVEEADSALDAAVTADALLSMVGARLYQHQKEMLGYDDKRIGAAIEEIVRRLLTAKGEPPG